VRDSGCAESASVTFQELPGHTVDMLFLTLERDQIMFVKKQVGMVALALASLTMSGAALALLDTGNVVVSATLTQACEVTAGTIGFGSIAAIYSTADKEAFSTDFSVACSTGTSPKIYTDSVRAMTRTAGGSLAFVLSDSTGGADLPTNSTNAIAFTGTKNGTLQNFPLYARVLAANFRGLPVGDYSGTVAVTVAY